MAGQPPRRDEDGPDGNLWFTDNGPAQAIGRFGVGAPAALIKSPSVGGNGMAGSRQACDGDRWSTWPGEQPSVHAFAFDGFTWMRDGAVIAGETHRTYRPTGADVGHELSCTVTVTYPLFPTTISAASAAVRVMPGG